MIFLPTSHSKIIADHVSAFTTFQSQYESVSICVLNFAKGYNFTEAIQNRPDFAIQSITVLFSAGL